MAELQKSLQPSPAQSVQYSRSRAIHHHHPPSQQQQQHFCQPDPPSRAGTATTTSSISTGTATIRRDVPPCRSPAQGQTANPSQAAQLARKSLSSPARTWPATCVKLSVMPTSTQRRRPLTRCRSSPRGGRLASWVTEFLQLSWAGRGNCGGSWVFERVGATLREAESPLWAGRGQRPLRNCREEFLQREERRETTKD